MKNLKRILSIFVYTAFDVEECKTAVEKCLKGVDLKKSTVVLSVERKHISVVGGEFTTLVCVVGDSRGGWESSGIKALRECLESSGYMVQVVNAAYSFIPNSGSTKA